MQQGEANAAPTNEDTTMKTITLQLTDLISTMTAAYDHMGSADWAIYVTTDGQTDLRHNTHPNGNWLKVTDCYGLYGSDSMEITEEEIRSLVNLWLEDVGNWMVEDYDDEGNSTEYTFEIVA